MNRAFLSFAFIVFVLTVSCSYSPPPGVLLDDRIGKEHYAKIDSTQKAKPNKPKKREFLIDDRIGKEKVIELGLEQLVIPDSLVIVKDVLPPDYVEMLKTVNYGGNIFGCPSEKEVLIKIVEEAKVIGANYVILINILPPTDFIDGFRCDAEFYHVKGGMQRTSRYFSIDAINKRDKDAQGKALLNGAEDFLFFLFY